ncbi:MAG: primary-amine oxidase [Microcoleaceae cyanobacterium]
MEDFPIVTDPALALFSPLVSEDSVIPMMPMAEPDQLFPETVIEAAETEIEEIDPAVDTVTGTVIDETVTYPLDPLTASEIETAVSVIQETQNLSEDTFFPRVALQEPPKDEVINYTEGNPFRREAFVIVFDSASNLTYEAIVDLNTDTLTRWVIVPDVTVQLLDPVDYDILEELTAEDPEILAALERRGLDIDNVYFTGWAPGRLTAEEEAAGVRFIRGVPYVIGDDLNFFGRPIEGLAVTVDLTNQEVFNVVDTGNIPINTESAAYGAEEVELREPLPPLEIVEPEGRSYEINGHKVSWDNWQFRYSIDPRSGLVIHEVNYRDGDILRPILYRGSLSELFVPYAEPNGNWVVRSALDVGEYSLGRFTYPMEVGRDLPENAVLLDAIFADDFGEPYLWEGAAGIYERQGGLLWSHFDFELTEEIDSRRSRELVVRSIMTIGNYDYGVNWVFQQDGTMTVETDSTGIVLVQGTEATDASSLSESNAYGNLVDPNLIGVNHQHFFNFRLDFDIDGVANTPVEMNIVPLLPGMDNPEGNAFVVEPTPLELETAAVRDVNVYQNRSWNIMSNENTNALGSPTAYKLVPGGYTFPMLSPFSETRQLGGFADHHFWATQYNPDELYAAGDYPNQGNPGQGLYSYISDNEPLAGEDVVVWYTMGMTHIVRPEDWPVMPVHRSSFKLKPWGFFNQNPALDVPPNPIIES